MVNAQADARLWTPKGAQRGYNRGCDRPEAGDYSTGHHQHPPHSSTAEHLLPKQEVAVQFRRGGQLPVAPTTFHTHNAASYNRGFYGSLALDSSSTHGWHIHRRCDRRNARGLVTAMTGTKRRVVRISALTFAAALVVMMRGPFTAADVAEETGLHRDTVYRLIEAMRQQSVCRECGVAPDTLGRMSVRVYSLSSSTEANT